MDETMPFPRGYETFVKASDAGWGVEVALKPAVTRRGGPYHKVAVRMNGLVDFGAGFSRGGRFKAEVRIQTPAGLVVVSAATREDGTPRVDASTQVSVFVSTPAEPRPEGVWGDHGGRNAEAGRGGEVVAASDPLATTLAAVVAAHRFECAGDVTRVRRAMALLLHADGVRRGALEGVHAAVNALLDEREADLARGTVPVR